MSNRVSRRRFLTYSTATIATATLLKACTESPSGTSSSQKSTEVRVGLLLPSSKFDKGFMESGYDGLRRSEEKHGSRIKTSFIESVSAADKEQAFVSLAEKSDLVIGIGGQSEKAGRKVAENFPNVKFVIVSATEPPTSNVASYGVRQAEIAFVAGAAAALLSKTGAVGYVGGFEIPAIVNAGIEFGNGAKYVKPDIKYYSQTTGDFDDVAKAKEAALAGISKGVDITYHILNLGLRGLEQAARETNTKLFGGYTARCGTDPLYVAYSVTGVGFEVEYAIDQMVAGSWKPEAKDFGLKAGSQASDVIVCTGATPEITKTIEQIKADIVSGKIKTLPG